MAIKKPKILVYDIETSPMQAWVWRCGDQTVRHNQLVKGEFDNYNIICITYAWLDGGAVQALVWDEKTHSSKRMVAEFDKIIRSADMTIGKNSDRFDVKMINTQRLLHDLDPLPEWLGSGDDLEKQMRRFFYLPSQSLDYISEMLGFGGKKKMEMADWVDIVTRAPNAAKKLKKMITYGKKDVADTRAIMKKVWPHVKPKFNMSAFTGEQVCVNCGSDDIHKNGTRLRGKVMYQKFHCKAHGGHAGEVSLKAKDGAVLS
jgi:DNA polymerase elongation subunit (family B)